MGQCQGTVSGKVGTGLVVLALPALSLMAKRCQCDCPWRQTLDLSALCGLSWEHC